MKKLMKRIGAVLMAVAMMAALGVSAWAVSSADKADVTITKIEKGATVTLYQIASGQYGGTGNSSFIKYNYVDGVILTGDGKNYTPDAPTEAEVTALAKGIQASPQTVAGTVVTLTDEQKTIGDNGTFTYNAPAGVYIAIITPPANNEKIYNPVLLATYYNSSSDLTGGTVDVTGKYLNPATAVAKSSTPTVSKEVTGTTADDTITEDDKDTASLGDELTYTVSITNPVYPDGATNKTFYIADKMEVGLDFQFDTLTVKNGDTALTKTVADGTATFKNGDTVVATAKSTDAGKGFHMSFVYDAAKDLNLSVVYNARVNESAVIGRTGNSNDVEYYYSNNPTKGQTHDTLDEKPTPGEATGIEMKEDKETVYTYQLEFLKTKEENAALANAVFGIYSDSACTQLVDKVKTNSDGYAVSTQVEKGTYYIKELEAPAGYTLNTNVYSMTAEWTSATTKVNGSQTVRTYTTTKPSDDAQVVGKIYKLKTATEGTFYTTEAFTAEDGYEWVDAYVDTETTTTTSSVETKTAGEGTVSALELDGQSQSSIVNTKNAELPSTGGIGTYVFTVAGVAIMAIAAGLLIVRHKKKAE